MVLLKYMAFQCNEFARLNGLLKWFLKLHGLINLHEKLFTFQVGVFLIYYPLSARGFQIF